MFLLKEVKYKDILYIKRLTIEEGEVACIVGKSGGGKTTFLKLLNNMVSYDTGSILFKDKDVREYNPVILRRMVPMLPQNPVIFPVTIRDNFIKTQEFVEQDIDEDSYYIELLKRVGLNKFKLSDNVKNLSGGEIQRLALARILLLNPTVMLLDEPSSALDESTEDVIINMVVNYIKRKRGTLIMVTHSVGIAERYADKVITIDNGIIANIRKRGQSAYE